MFDHSAVSGNPQGKALSVKPLPLDAVGTSLEIEGHAPALIIAGMHRSGTSFVTSLLHKAGLNVGERILPPDIGNVLGHFENRDFVELHELILRRYGLDHRGWIDLEKVDVSLDLRSIIVDVIRKNSTQSAWGWKDPRTCLFLDFWARALPSANFLFVYRSPWQVMDSLYRRGTDEPVMKRPSLALKFWVNYNKAILRTAKQYPDRTLLIPLDFVIANSQKLLQTIEQRFSLKLNHAVENPFAEKHLAKLTRPHNYALQLKVFFPEVFAVWQELEAQSFPKFESCSSFVIATEEAVQDSVLDDWAYFKNIEGQIALLRTETARLKEHADELEATVNMQNQSLGELKELREENKRLAAALEQRDALLAEVHNTITWQMRNWLLRTIMRRGG